MKIILDTNVFVAAGFNRHSSSAAILQAVETGELCMVWTQRTRSETRMILEKIPPLSWQKVASLFTAEHEYTGELVPERYAQVADDDDRKFAALAVAVGGVLVTNDDDLLSVREQLPVQVLSPGAFCMQYMR